MPPVIDFPADGAPRQLRDPLPRWLTYRGMHASNLGPSTRKAVQLLDVPPGFPGWVEVEARNAFAEVECIDQVAGRVRRTRRRLSPAKGRTLYRVGPAGASIVITRSIVLDLLWSPASGEYSDWALGSEPTDGSEGDVRRISARWLEDRPDEREAWTVLIGALGSSGGAIGVDVDGADIEELPTTVAPPGYARRFRIAGFDDGAGGGATGLGKPLCQILGPDGQARGPSFAADPHTVYWLGPWEQLTIGNPSDLDGAFTGVLTWLPAEVP